MNTRIKLSKYWWNNLYITVFVAIVFDIYVCSFWMEGFVSSMGGIAYFIFAMLNIMLIDVAFGKYRMLVIINIQKDKIESQLFYKKLCLVSLEKPIYYKIFECRESMFKRAKYIAISNDIIEYDFYRKNLYPEKRYIDSYDLRKVILLPYSIENVEMISSHL